MSEQAILEKTHSKSLIYRLRNSVNSKVSFSSLGITKVDVKFFDTGEVEFWWYIEGGEAYIFQLPNQYADPVFHPRCIYQNSNHEQTIIYTFS